MFYFVCTKCGKRSLVKSKVSRKYCDPCSKLVISANVRAYREKNIEKISAYSRAYQSNRYRSDAAFRDKAIKRLASLEFRWSVRKRLAKARLELNNHLSLVHQGGVIPDLTNCNLCIVKQGKLDCQEKLYEDNFIVRDVMHGDIAVAPACVVNLVRPLSLVKVEGFEEVACSVCNKVLFRRDLRRGEVCSSCVWVFERKKARELYGLKRKGGYLNKGK